MSFFGKNIKKLRTLNNLSQQEFGNLFGLSRASIGSYEEGRADPKIDSLIKIARHFNLNIDQLLTSEIHNLDRHEKPEVIPEVPKSPDSKKYLEERVESLEQKIEKIENLLNQST